MFQKQGGKLVGGAGRHEWEAEVTPQRLSVLSITFLAFEKFLLPLGTQDFYIEVNPEMQLLGSLGCLLMLMAVGGDSH